MTNAQESALWAAGIAELAEDEEPYGATYTINADQITAYVNPKLRKQYGKLLMDAGIVLVTMRGLPRRSDAMTAYRGGF